MKTNLDQLAGAIQVDFLRQFSGAQHLRRKVVNVGYGFSADSLKKLKVLDEIIGTKHYKP